MSNVLGIDCSKWQKDMDWQKCDAAGAKFAFIRAGSINNVTGECYTDYHFIRNSSLASEYMPIGFYWYFRPQYDPIKQANYFCDLIRNENWKLPPVIDLENTGGLNDQQVTNAAVAFVADVYDRLRVWCLMYARAYWLNIETVYHPLFDEMDLWIARYNSTLTHPWGDADKFPILKPEDWDDWKFWQFSAGSNGRGAEFGAKSKSIDLDYFNGDQAAFDAYINKPPESPLPVFELPDRIGIKLDVPVKDEPSVKYRGHVDKVV